MFLKTKSATTASAVRPLSFSEHISASSTLDSVSSEPVGDSVQLGVANVGLPPRSRREGLVVVLHGKPLKVPSFNVVLKGDVKVLYSPAPTKLQTGTTNKLMLSSGHTGPIVVKLSPKPKVGQNSKERLAKVHKNGNLMNIVGV
jgi:hypothetical protein